MERGGASSFPGPGQSLKPADRAGPALRAYFRFGAGAGLTTSTTTDRPRQTLA